MKAYFDSCMSCKNGVIEFPNKTTVSKIIDACKSQWGEGSLIRTKSLKPEFIWRKDEDAKWIGCCADKVYGKGKQ